jgi:hypothetical protein
MRYASTSDQQPLAVGLLEHGAGWTTDRGDDERTTVAEADIDAAVCGVTESRVPADPISCITSCQGH